MARAVALVLLCVLVCVSAQPNGEPELASSQQRAGSSRKRTGAAHRAGASCGKRQAASSKQQAGRPAGQQEPGSRVADRVLTALQPGLHAQTVSQPVQLGGHAAREAPGLTGVHTGSEQRAEEDTASRPQGLLAGSAQEHAATLTPSYAGYYNVAPPGQAPVPVATGNDYAPTPAGAAIILRTDLVLRLNTSAEFAGTSQTNFATALRSLLAPYGFMSVAVSGFSVRFCLAAAVAQLRLNPKPEFACTSQTSIATALRSLLAPYGSKSVAVSSFSVSSHSPHLSRQQVARLQQTPARLRLNTSQESASTSQTSFVAALRLLLASRWSSLPGSW